MKLKIYLIFFLVSAYFLTCCPALAVYTDLPEVDVRAAAAILVEANSGEILYPQDQANIHDRREPASLTKIMTCMIVLEMIGDWEARKNDIVTVSSAAFFDVTADGSNSAMKDGEEFRLEDLLYCVMLQSANEGCNVLGEYLAGSAEAFVELMNQRAQELGCVNTRFSNTHGLPAANHYTTAYDMYLITAQAIKTPHFMEITHTDSHTVKPTNKTPNSRKLNTTNSLISTSNYSEYIYPLAKGIKTGHTVAAGYCLASTAEKDNLHLISVVMGAAKDENGLIRSFVETKLLFEWGFDNFETRKLLAKSKPVREIPVLRGVGKEAVTLVAEEEIYALVPKNLDLSDIEEKVYLDNPEGVYAPVYKDMIYGTVTLQHDGHVYGKVNLLALYDVQENAPERMMETIQDIIRRPWVRWTALGVIGLIALYVAFTILHNMQRRKKRKSQNNYRGRRR